MRRINRIFFQFNIFLKIFFNHFWPFLFATFIIRNKLFLYVFYMVKLWFNLNSKSFLIIYDPINATLLHTLLNGKENIIQLDSQIGLNLNKFTPSITYQSICSNKVCNLNSQTSTTWMSLCSLFFSKQGKVKLFRPIELD